MESIGEAQQFSSVRTVFGGIAEKSVYLRSFDLGQPTSVGISFRGAFTEEEPLKSAELSLRETISLPVHFRGVFNTSERFIIGILVCGCVLSEIVGAKSIVHCLRTPFF